MQNDPAAQTTPMTKQTNAAVGTLEEYTTTTGNDSLAAELDAAAERHRQHERGDHLRGRVVA